MEGAFNGLIGSLHTWMVPLSHITPNFIPIRARRDHKSSNSLPQNTVEFPKLKLETTWLS